MSTRVFTLSCEIYQDIYTIEWSLPGYLHYTEKSTRTCQLVIIVVICIFYISESRSDSCISVEFLWLSYNLFNLNIKEFNAGAFTNTDSNFFKESTILKYFLD